jgi:hypothetical protein
VEPTDLLGLDPASANALAGQPGLLGGRSTRAVPGAPSVVLEQLNPIRFPNPGPSAAEAGIAIQPLSGGIGTLGNGSNPNPQIAIVTLSPSQDSPQPVGNRITWTARAVNLGDNPVYRFSVGLGAGPLYVVQDFSSSDTYTWAPLQEGTYSVMATALGDGGQTVVESPVVIYTVYSRVAGNNPVVTATANPLVALYSAPPSAANSMRVDFRPVLNPAPWMSSGVKPVIAGQSTNIIVAGMLPDTTYEMVGVTDLGPLAPVFFTTADPPMT